MPRWRNKANCRGRADPGAKPAKVPDGQRQERRRTDKRPGQNHRCRRAKATTWDATKYLRPAETTCNSITTSDSRFASRTGQRFHFFLVNLDFARLLHLLAQVGNEQPEEFLLLALQQRIANLVALGREVSLGWGLHVCYCNDHSVFTPVDRPPDVSRLHFEGNRSLSRHRSNIRNLSIGRNELARLHRGAQLFCRFLLLLLCVGGVGGVGGVLWFGCVCGW